MLSNHLFLALSFFLSLDGSMERSRGTRQNGCCTRQRQVCIWCGRAPTTPATTRCVWAARGRWSTIALSTTTANSPSMRRSSSRTSCSWWRWGAQQHDSSVMRSNIHDLPQIKPMRCSYQHLHIHKWYRDVTIQYIITVYCDTVNFITFFFLNCHSIKKHYHLSNLCKKKKYTFYPIRTVQSELLSGQSLNTTQNHPLSAKMYAFWPPSTLAVPLLILEKYCDTSSLKTEQYPIYLVPVLNEWTCFKIRAVFPKSAALQRLNPLSAE